MRVTQDNPFANYDTREQIYGGRQRKLSQLGYVLLIIIAEIALYGLLIAIGAKALRSGTSLVVLFSLIGILVLPLFAFELWGVFLSAIYRPRIAAKVGRKYGIDTTGTWFVGVAPGKDFRLFAGDSSLDFGLISIEPGRIVFYGDILCFELSRESVRDMDIQEVRVGLKIRRILLTWIDATGQPQELALEYEDAVRAFSKSRATEKLLHALQSWHKYETALRQVPEYAEPPIDETFSSLQAISLPEAHSSCLSVLGAIVMYIIISELFDWLHLNSMAPWGIIAAILILIAVAIKISRYFKKGS